MKQKRCLHLKSRLLAFLLAAWLFSGCVPPELEAAGRQFANENYPAAVRMLDEYLSHAEAGMASDADDDDFRFHLNVARFYRGLSTRGCVVGRRIADSDAARRRIVEDYVVAASDARLEGIVSFHAGLEAVMADEFKAARVHLKRFSDLAAEGRISHGHFGGDALLAECAAFAWELLEDLSAQMEENRDDMGRRVFRWYRRTMYAKTQRHEIHNMKLLLRRHAIRRFRFVDDVLDLSARYDSVMRTVECGRDHLRVDGLVEAEVAAVEARLRDEGFADWRRLDKGEMTTFTCAYSGFKLALGGRPVKILRRKDAFGKTLLAILPVGQGALHCLVVETDDLRTGDASPDAVVAVRRDAAGWDWKLGEWPHDRKAGRRRLVAHGGGVVADLLEGRGLRFGK